MLKPHSRENLIRGVSTMNNTIVAVDLAKSVFQLAGLFLDLIVGRVKR
jgi:hypothetical protein